MNKIIKKISILLIVITLLIMLVACSDGNSHKHSYSEKSDDTYYWQECSCGDIKNKRKHKFEFKYDDTYHWEECEVCGYIKNKEEHSYGEWQITQEATCTQEGQKKKECSCGKTIYETIPPKEHNYVFAYDKDLHWKECSKCGEIQGNKVSHTFDEITHKCECGLYDPTYSTYGLTYKLNDTKNAYIITRYIGSDNDVIIPEKYENLPVTTIGTSAFEDSTITSIKLPTNLTTIEDKAFSNCNFINEIILPENVKTIGTRAFYSCDKLTTLSIPAGIINVAEEAFLGNSQIGYLTLPTSVINKFQFMKRNLKKVVINGGTEIPEDAFYSVTETCPILKEVVLSNTITSIGKNAFCKSGLEKINIPSSITEIGLDAFKCQNLKEVHVEDLSAWCNINMASGYSTPLYFGDLYINNKLATDITIPTNVDVIKDYTFYKCKTIKTVNITNSTQIGEYAFAYCDNLENVNFSNNLTKIGNYAFNQDTKINKIILPDSVNEIGKHAFYNCLGFTEIYIPQNVNKIGAYAFDNRNLIIYCNNKVSKSNWDTNWSNCKKIEYVENRPNN